MKSLRDLGSSGRPLRGRGDAGRGRGAAVEGRYSQVVVVVQDADGRQQLDGVHHHVRRPGVHSSDQQRDSLVGGQHGFQTVLQREQGGRGVSNENHYQGWKTSLTRLHVHQTYSLRFLKWTKKSVAVSINILDEEPLQ